jgi:glutathione S-transferase
MTMKLYSFQPSPYGSRVRLALRRKGIPFDVAPPTAVNPQQSSFLAPSPMEVPTPVADDGTAVSGSAAILDYLEDAHPAPPLLPKAPEARARARMLVQTTDTYIQDAPRKLFGMADPAKRDPAAIEEAFGMIETGLAFVDTRLDGHDGWAVGGAPSIADCALVPVLNAIALLGSIHGRSDVISRHPRLGAYWAAAQNEPLNAALLAEQLAGLPAPLQSVAKAAAGAAS